MLDQYGFERSTRKFVFAGDEPKERIYFTNVAPAHSALGKFLSTFFDRFDLPNFARPVYATATARLGGGHVESAVTPYELRFAPDNSTRRPPELMYSDFRRELLSKRKRTLNIVIQSFDGAEQVAQKIGRLELGDFVVSDFCDLELNFHHDPIEDQWKKYSDYEVVKKFAPKP